MFVEIGTGSCEEVRTHLEYATATDHKVMNAKRKIWKIRRGPICHQSSSKAKALQKRYDEEKEARTSSVEREGW